MPTESTAAPASVETTTTPAPIEGATTVAAPAAIPGLAEAVADYKGHRASVMHKPAPAVETPAAGATTEAPAKVVDKPADAAVDKKPDADPAKVAKPEPKPDEVADGMVKILRQSRALDRQRREIEAEKAATATAKAAADAERAENAKAIEAARKFEETRKKDPVSATMELLGKEAMGGTFPLDLINRLSQQEDGQPPTPEQIATAAAETAVARIKAEQAEQAKAKEAADAKAKEEATKARTADIDQKRQAFFTGLAHQLSADAEKYPYLVAKPVDWPEVDKFVLGQYQATGRAPSPEEIFKHFDGEREKDAAALTGVYLKRNPKAAEAKPKPVTSTARAATEAPRDTRGRVEVPPAGETQRERLERVARELNQLSR